MQFLHTLVLCSLVVNTVYSFSTPTLVRPPVTTDVLDTKAFKETSSVTKKFETKDVVTNIVVAGATGRTGRYVVEELLQRGVPNVIALVRDMNKAKEVFTTPLPDNLQIVECNYSNETQISNIISSMKVDAAIWCATGFTDAATVPKPATVSFIDQLKRTFGLPVTTSPVIVSDQKQQSIDLIGLPAIAKSLVEKQQPEEIALPKIVMCSSAGVTRTIWDEEKKSKYVGAADIPIVRLNPFNILDRKRESEEVLRSMSVSPKYCIVRPCGLNDNWPMNSRPIFTQGDVAVGRLHRKDLAKVLVDVLSTPEATYKTFEVVGIANYPPSAVGIGPALQRLYTDAELKTIPDDIVFATYTAMQQLLPGETQDAAALAMGQTYEQLDSGTVGRLGVRGQEKIDGVAPKPS